jgi:hypothetical protein
MIMRKKKMIREVKTYKWVGESAREKELQMIHTNLTICFDYLLRLYY